MKPRPVQMVLPVLLAIAAVGATAFAAEDRSSLQIPDGLPFAHIKGFEAWEPVSVSQTETPLRTLARSACRPSRRMSA